MLTCCGHWGHRLRSAGADRLSAWPGQILSRAPVQVLSCETYGSVSQVGLTPQRKSRGRKGLSRSLQARRGKSGTVSLPAGVTEVRATLINVKEDQ